MSPVPRKTTWVAVADGAKALIFVNEGNPFSPQLRVLAKDELENPKTSEQGADRPGRRSDSGAGQRSAMEETDWHALGEARFVREFAGRVNRAAERQRFEELVLIAPPRVLGELRAALSAAASERIAAEVTSDLTGHPVNEIEAHLAKALKG